MIFLKTPNRVTNIVLSRIKCDNCSLIKQCTKYYEWSDFSICIKFFYGYKVRKL